MESILFKPKGMYWRTFNCFIYGKMHIFSLLIWEKEKGGIAMGGFGSGRIGSKQLVTQKQHLDIRALNRSGYLKFGTNRLHLDYKYYHQGKQHPVWIVVELTWTPCNYGGQRPWFFCPDCGKRVAILYVGQCLRCRSCYDLVYPSENEARIDRLYRKARKMRDLIGASHNMAHWIVKRPKYMRGYKFEEIRNKCFEVEREIMSEYAKVQMKERRICC